MDVYPFDQRASHKLKQKQLRRWCVLLGAFFGFIWGGLLVSAGRFPDLISVWVSVLVMSLGLFAICAIGLRRYLTRQETWWKEAVLEIDATDITLKNSDTVAVNIPFDQIEACSIRRGGVQVRAGNSQHRQLFIPSSITGYSEIKQRLAPYAFVPKRPLHQIVLVTLLLGGMGFIMLWTLFGREPQIGSTIFGASVVASAVFYLIGSL